MTLTVTPSELQAATQPPKAAEPGFPSSGPEPHGYIAESLDFASLRSG